MRNIMKQLINKILKTDAADQQVKDIQQPVIDARNQTIRKINTVNSMLMKTKTYYIGKAMGVIQ